MRARNQPILSCLETIREHITKIMAKKREEIKNFEIKFYDYIFLEESRNVIFFINFISSIFIEILY